MLNFGPYQRQFCSEMNRSVQCVDCAVNAKTRLEVYNSNSVPILLTHWVRRFNQSDLIKRRPIRIVHLS